MTTETMKILRNNAEWLTGGKLLCPKCGRRVDEDSWMSCFPEPDECAAFRELEVVKDDTPT